MNGHSHEPARPPARPPARRSGEFALWASASVLTVLILSQVGRLMSGAPALADVTAVSGEFQMLSVDAGSDDICVVLDQRGEALVIYRATQTGLQFLGKRDLREMFFQARQAGK